MTKLLLVCTVFAATLPLRADQAAVRIEPTNLHGPRVLVKQTETAVIQDYLEGRGKVWTRRWGKIGLIFSTGILWALPRKN